MKKSIKPKFSKKVNKSKKKSKRKSKNFSKKFNKTRKKSKSNRKKKQYGGMENYYCNGIIPNIKIIPERGFDLKTLLNDAGIGMPPKINL